jgi:hypothetical protein
MCMLPAVSTYSSDHAGGLLTYAAHGCHYPAPGVIVEAHFSLSDVPLQGMSGRVDIFRGCCKKGSRKLETIRLS